MKKLPYKKILTGVFIFAAIFLLVGAGFAHAQATMGGALTPAAPTNPNASPSLNWEACGANLFTCSIYGISTFVNFFLNLLVDFGGVLVNIGIFLDGQVFSSPTVLAGFSVSLAIANLGFVLGIIVIALATILRNETYGIKQMLWKLVVMAILVNFGLVICGPIVGLSDSFTNYFLNASGGASNFSSNLTNAFAPQTLFQAPQITSSNSVLATACSSWLSNIGGLLTGTVYSTACSAATGKIFNSDNSGAGDFTRSIMSLIFSAVFLAITALTFITIGILLVVRYVYLAILLILLPLAWLMWIFPKFNHHWTEWWSLFIKWTLFPAISLFFIYLAFQSVTIASNGQAIVNVGNGASANITDNTVAGFIIQTGSVNLLQTALDELLMCGLCLGGLYAANAMSIKGADSAIHAASWAGGHIKNYAGRQSSKAARFGYQRVLKGDRINKAMQRSRIPLVSTIGSGLADLTEKGGKKQVADADKRLGLSSMSDDRLINRTQGLGALDKDGQIAAVAEWQKRGKLDRIKEVGGMSLQEWFDRNKQTLDDYDQGKLSADINKTLSSSKGQRTAAKAMGTASVVDTHGIMGTAGATVNAVDLSEASKKILSSESLPEAAALAAGGVTHNGQHIQLSDLLTNAKDSAKSADDAMDNVDVVDTDNDTGRGAGSMVKAGELMNKAAEKFWKGKDRGDVAKMRPDYIFGSEGKLGMDAHTVKALAKGITHGMATQTPSHLGSMISKLDNKKAMTAFVEDFKESVEKALASGKMTREERNELIGKKGDFSNPNEVGALYKSMARKYVVGGGGGAGEHSGAAAGTH